MNLLHQEQIEKLDNCPTSNQSGEIKLYRWVNKDYMETSFTPHAFKEKFKNNCEAWGLSTYNNKQKALEYLNSASSNIKKKYNSIAFCNINDESGIKHQSGNNLHHYTFYPDKDFDLVNNFQILENDE